MPIGDPVWDPTVVPVYRITFAETDWEGALAALIPDDSCDDRPYLVAEVDYENPRSGETEHADRVGVRYRGHSALSEGQRFGFKLSFNEAVDEGEFHGLHNVNLMGTEGDFSLMRERLAQQVGREAGVPAPRVSHARLYVNDTYLGVFPFPEEPDDDPYLDNHFEDTTGGLYKVDGYCGGAGDFVRYGDDPSRYVERFEPKADTTVEQLEADLFPLFDCAAEPDDELRRCLPELIDVDEWITEIAVDVVLPDVDGLAGAGQNFLLYDDPADGRLVVYPWDKDQAFSTDNAVSRSIWSIHPAWAEPNALASRIRTVWAEEFCAEVLRVAALADPGTLEARAETLRELLREPMADDPWYAAEGRTWDWDVDSLVRDLSEHHDDAVAEATACSPP